jgi:hypothetical protein
MGQIGHQNMRAACPLWAGSGLRPLAATKIPNASDHESETVRNEIARGYRDELLFSATAVGCVHQGYRHIEGSEDCIDCAGRRIRWEEYGNRSHPYGWEVDHFPIPQCDGRLGRAVELESEALHRQCNGGRLPRRLLSRRGSERVAGACRSDAASADEQCDARPGAALLSQPDSECAGRPAAITAPGKGPRIAKLRSKILVINDENRLG